MSTSSCGFVSWRQTETSNLTAKCESSCDLLEIARRILVLISVIIPITGLIANCFKSDPQILPSNVTAVSSAPSASAIAAITGIEVITVSEPQAAERICIGPRLMQRCPTLFHLVYRYQRGATLTKDEFVPLCIRVLVGEVGFAENKVFTSSEYDRGRDLLFLSPIEIFTKICQKLGIEDKVILTNTGGTHSNTRLFAHIAMNSAADYAAVVEHGGQMTVCQGYDVLYGARGMYYRDKPALLLAGSEYQTIRDILVANDILPIQQLYTGKIPNVEGCSLDVCIALLSYLAPVV